MCARLAEGLPEEEVFILPFYVVLEGGKQVFHVFGDGRKIAVATNVAETSLTIPGIAYVVGSGWAKAKVCRGGESGAMSLSCGIVWMSKAGSEQRAGLSGRTGPWIFYQLSSSRSLHSSTFTNPKNERNVRIAKIS